MSAQQIESRAFKLSSVVLLALSIPAIAQVAKQATGKQPGATGRGTASNVRKVALPASFPTILQKVVQASLNSFKSITGGPMDSVESLIGPPQSAQGTKAILRGLANDHRFARREGLPYYGDQFGGA